MSRVSSRIVAGLATVAVAASLTTPAQADPSPSSSAAATWLDRELQAGLFQSSFGGPDVGLNIDAGFALVQAGDDAAATELRDAIEPATDGYISGEAFGDAGSTYANATAKLLAFVEASGGDPTSYDGKDLVARLEAQVADGTGEAPDGAIFDTSTFGSFTNVLGQAFAAQGLSEVGSAEADDVTDFLLAQQCVDGHFPLEFRTAGENGCAEAPSVDVTALVVTALREQADDPAVTAALLDAADHIAAEQAADGSVGGAPPTTAPNANTTGLAAWALGETCDLDNAYRAAAWTRDLQVGTDEAGTALADEVGAIAYDQATLDRDAADGIGDSERDQYRRSTAQAGNGLAYDRSAPATVGLRGPSDDFVKADSVVTFEVTGIDDGDAPCLVGPGARELVGDDTSTASVDVVTPARTTRARYTATTGPGTDTATVRVLAGKRFRSDIRSARIPEDKKQRITVRGFTKGESITVRYQGRAIERAVARKRSFTTAFDVTRTRGKQRVQVLGEFGNRKAVEKFRVVRSR